MRLGIGRVRRVRYSIHGSSTNTKQQEAIIMYISYNSTRPRQEGNDPNLSSIMLAANVPHILVKQKTCVSATATGRQ